MRNLGTSSLVVAAFVGPGTVLTCAAAGVQFSYSLGWVLVLATVAVFVLQTFTAGSGILAKRGLGEAIREVAEQKWFRIPLFAMVILGLWIGAAAFETGNLVGTAAGLDILLDSPVDERLWSILAAIVAALILVNDLKIVRKILTVLVGVMSLLFLASAVLGPLDWSAIARGLVVPTIPDGSVLTVIALVGTTVVTYNLFLHASATKQYWSGKSPHESWKRERFGMAIILPLGGVISLGIMFTGAPLAEGSQTVTEIHGFVSLLEPLAGRASRVLFGTGLLAAGITSAVTAPLAVAGGISELLNWTGERRVFQYRFLWITVLLTGLLFSLSGFSPLNIIIAAQAANGFLLPFMAGVLVYVTVRQKEVPLSRAYLGAGLLIVIFCTALGIRTLAWVWTNLI